MDDDSPDRPLHDLRWTKQALVLWPLGSGEKYEIPWGGLSEIEGIDPCPTLRFVWQGGVTPSSFILQSWPYNKPLFEKKVELAIEIVQEMAPSAVRSGWIGALAVDWEPTREWPSRQLSPAATGYRHATIEQPIEEDLAVRGRRRLWGRRKNAVPAPVAALTDRFVYVRGPDGRITRIPLATLRVRLGSAEGCAFVFGRATLLALPADSLVAVALDEWLKDGRFRLGIRSRADGPGSK